MSSQPTTVGYCRACGKALSEADVRAAHGTIYCEEHVPVTPNNPQTVPPQPTSFEQSPYTNPYTAQGAPPPIPNNDVSPGLAFLLGTIPGVGAIYNGQYAKGIVHVFIVGVMISILSSGSAHGFEP